VMKKDVSSHMKELGGNIKSDWTEVYKSSTAWVGKTADGINKGFQEMGKNVGIQMNKAADTISEVWDKALAVFNINTLTQIGKDMISGLIVGINSMTDKAIESITGMVNGVVTKAKDLLGIASPADVFVAITDKVGLKSISDAMRKSKKNDKRGPSLFSNVLAQQFELAGVQ
ncbi:MAG: hypothetical protein RR595_16240, partial [Lysinibacillus sp.]